MGMVRLESLSVDGKAIEFNDASISWYMDGRSKSYDLDVESDQHPLIAKLGENLKFEGKGVDGSLYTGTVILTNVSFGHYDGAFSLKGNGALLRDGTIL